MSEFRQITLKDKEIITDYIMPSDHQDCDLSFANLYSWQFMNESSYAIINQQLVIRFTTQDKSHEYFMPIGKGSIIPAIDTLEEIARAEGESLRLRGRLPEMQILLEQCYPTLFEFESNRDTYDYIYLRTDLAELRGKNYQPKRNHVNKFRKEYTYEYLPLTSDIIPECLDFEARWCMNHGYIENENIKSERRALTHAMRHYDELGLTGGAIRVDGRIIAFTFGAPINQQTFGVHFEKADISIDGAYSAINQEFASRLPEQYIYLNREEDMGIPGLRQAKTSYHPVLLLEKGIAIKK